jgi:hypothetical protein
MKKLPKRNSENPVLRGASRLLTALFLFFLSQFPGFTQELNISPQPGVYNKDIFLRLENEVDVYYSFLDDSYIQYRGPMFLSALDGETREYQIRFARLIDDELVVINEFIYQIDKKKPAAVSPLPSPQIVQPGQSIRFDNVDRIFYKLSWENSDFRQWDGSAISIPADAEAGSYRISAYSQDKAGNRSSLKQFDYVVQGSSGTKFEIISPVAGSFRNLQLLYIENSGYSDILYTLDGSDPLRYGRDYREPFLIERRGTVILKVAARKLGSNEYEYYETEYDSEIDSLYGSSIPVQGFLRGEFQFSLPEGTRYTFGDRSVSASSQSALRPLVLKSDPGQLKTLVLRTLNANQQRRFVWIVDDRLPPAPQIIRSDEGSQVYVELYSSNDSEIFYSFDTGDPVTDGRRYEQGFSLNKTDRAVILRAQARLPSGIVSQVSEFRFFDDVRAPEVPLVELLDGNLIRVSSDAKLVYEIGSAENVSNPGLYSPEWKGDQRILVPEGFAGDFVLLFRAVDDSGNFSDIAPAVSISLDRQPPAPPIVTLAEGVVTIEGEGDIRYEVYPGIRSPNLESPKYNSALSIEDLVPEGSSGTWTITASSYDEQGNRSINSQAVKFDLEDLDPYRGFLSNIQDGAVVAYEAASFYFPPDSEIFYELTNDGSEPAAPGENSTRFSGSLNIPGIENQRIEYWLKFRYVDSEEINSYRFVIDLDPPDVPEFIDEIPPISNKNITIQAPEVGELETLWLSINSGSRTERLRLKDTYILDVPKGRDIQYELYLEAIDDAGNSSRSAAKTIRIDKKAPEVPEFAGLGDSEIYFENIQLSLPSLPEDVVVHYEVSSSGLNPARASLNSPVYSSPILLRGQAEEIREFSISYIARDSAGNTSPEGYIRGVFIDLRSIPQPPEPAISYQNRYIAVWQPEPGYELFVARGDEDFSPYQLPINLQVGENSLRWYHESGTGKRSAIYQKNYTIPALPDRLVNGLQSGQSYNSELRINNISGGGVLRYELGDISNDFKVNQFSPVMDQILSISPTEGETSEYLIKFGWYPDSSSPFRIRTEEYRIFFDLEAPDAPRLTGVPQTNSFLGSTRISFEQQEGTIYFALLSGASLQAREDQFTRYQVPFDVESDEDRLAYTLEAYAEDSAGNRSEKKRWTIFFDEEIVYASPRGNDLATGSEEFPVKTLEKAIAIAESEGKGIIFLQRGEYLLENDVMASRELVLVGGFSRDSWSRQEGRSLISHGAVKQGEAKKFIIQNAVVQLSNIEFLGVPIEMDRALVRASALTIYPTFSHHGMIVRDSVLQLSGSTFEGIRSTVPAVLSEGAEISIESSIFKGQYQGSKSAVIEIQGGSFTFLDSEIAVNALDIQTGLLLKNVESEIDGSTISSASGRGRFDAISLEDGVSRIENTNLSGSDELFSFTALKTLRTDVALNQVRILAYSSGIMMDLKGGDVVVNNSTVRLLSQAEFFSFVRTDKTVLTAVNNLFIAASATDYQGLRLKDGNSRWIHNTFIHFNGKVRSIGSNLEGRGEHSFINNIYAENGRGTRSTAFEPGSSSLILHGNVFAGWTYYLSQITAVENLNRADAITVGGRYNLNSSADFFRLFQTTKGESYLLSKDSPARNTGVPEISSFVLDRNQLARPNVDDGSIPDPGAFEYYPMSQ